VSGIKKIKEYIDDNKDFLQTTSSILLGVAGLVVAYQAYKVGGRQALVMEAEQSPFITIQPSIKSGSFALKIDNTGGPVRNLEIRHKDILWLYLNKSPNISASEMRFYYNKALNRENVHLERFVGGRTNITVKGFAENIDITGSTKGTLATVSDDKSIRNLIKRDSDFDKESRFMSSNNLSASLDLATCLEVKYTNLFNNDKTEYYCTLIDSFSTKPKIAPFHSFDESYSQAFNDIGSSLEYNVNGDSGSLYDIYTKSIIEPKIIKLLDGGNKKLDGYVSYFRPPPYFPQSR
jgi:hypothetical protein